MKDVKTAGSRRTFVGAGVLALAAPFFAIRQATGQPASGTTPLDAERMRALIAVTMLTMDTPHPVPYGAEIFDTNTGESLLRALNAVGEDLDPSAHGEIHAIRLACAKLKSLRLKGYTLYTTCEPCPMCMSCCLWAGLDRVVYGATIEDAARFGHQIMIPSAEVARRTDLKCEVAGPLERDRALELFTNAKMQARMKHWK
jgi:tRNA(Arg) A34 adenosine deaminase TadA